MALRIAAALLLASLAALLPAPASAEKVYAWTDAQGVTHYSQTPPDQRKYREISLRGNTRTAEEEVTPPPPLSPAEALAAARRGNCDQARRNLEALKSTARLTRMGTDGKPAPITDEQRAAEITRTEAEIAQYCDAQ